MESPFTAHSPSGLSNPLQGFQHRLDMNSTCWDFKNPTSTIHIRPTTKTHVYWMNFEQIVAPRNMNSFSMKLQLQKTTKHVHNNCLQASTLRSPLLAKKFHVKKISLCQKRECLILVSYPYTFPLFLLIAWIVLFPKLILLIPHSLNNYGKWLSHQPLLHEFND